MPKVRYQSSHAILIFPELYRRFLPAIKSQTFHNTREYREHDRRFAARRQNDFDQPESDVIHPLTWHAVVVRWKAFGGRFPSDETVAHEAAQSDRESFRLGILVVWVLLVGLFVDSYDHLADWEACEAVDLPEAPEKGGRGDDGAGAEGDCLGTGDYVAHDDC